MDYFLKNFFRQAGFYLLQLGTLGTIASYLAGNNAGEGMEEGALARAIEQHEQAATIALWLTIITAATYLGIYIFKYKKSWTRIISIVLFAGVIGAIARTGYLGGQLVYKHGAGVQLSLPDFSNPDSEK
ncbi:MAG: DUF2231 domain-containing protein [Chitinophagaceae bacterium]|nr:DUF2231 domain-containing protein [Chitinophagaceae bacterium]